MLFRSENQLQDDVVLESRSRSRIVIKQEVIDVTDPQLRGLKALPGAVGDSRWRWHWIGLIAIFATAIGAFTVWALVSPAPMLRVVRSVRLTHSGRVSPYSLVLTDATRLYFTETVGATRGLAQVPVAGGEPSPIAVSLPSVGMEDIDRSKSRLLISAQAAELNTPLWAVPTAGGSAQRLADTVGSSAAWSPNGHKMIYCREGTIYLAEVDGTQSRILLSLRGIIDNVRWSPDGSRIRFTVEDPTDGGRSVWEAAPDGGNPHPLSWGWKNFAHRWGEGEYNGDWTPDGKYFVFRSDRDGVQSFWAIREEPSWLHRAAGAPVQIYTSPDRMGEPRFSLNGKRMFFAGYQAQRELVRYDTERKMFVPYLGGISARLLAFSPDGQWVAYKSDVDGTLWRSRADGTEKLQLTFSPMFAMHSAWSPDGKTIVFQGASPGEGSKLYTISLAGGTPQLLLQDKDASTVQPSWCGDGRNVMFLRWSYNASDRRGSGVALLDTNTHETRVLPGTDGFDGAHCSPDGKYAAAADQRNHKLMLFDFSQQRWNVLSDGTPYGWGIRWTSDSQYIYYQHADEEEEQPIFRVRISDRKVEQITSSRQILRADVLSYTMTGLTPDNSPLASLVRRNSDVYALEMDVP